MTAPRPLPFPLYNSSSLTSIVGLGEEFFDLPTFPTDNDERTYITLDISLNEFKKIATAVDVGSDIAYAEDAVYIWWLWTRVVMPESICEAIVRCITENQATRDAVAGVFLDSPNTAEYEKLLLKLQDDLENPVTPTTSTDCNNKLFGASREFVTVLNQNAVDFLELIAVSPVKQGANLSAIIASAPLLDELGLDAIAQTAVWALEQVSAYYIASYTDEYRDALACEVFCSVKDTCQISVDDFYQVLKARADFSITNPDDIVQVAIAIAQVTFTGAADRVCDVWLYWQMELARLGNVIADGLGAAQVLGFGTSLSRLRTQLALGLSRPSTDWLTLCNCLDIVLEIFGSSGTPSLTFDAGKWYLSLQAGTYAYVRVQGGDNTCAYAFRMQEIVVESGTPTGREWQNCPSETYDSANAPVTDMEDILMSYFAVSSTTGIGGTDFTISFTVSAS